MCMHGRVYAWIRTSGEQCLPSFVVFVFLHHVVVELAEVWVCIPNRSCLILASVFSWMNNEVRCVQYLLFQQYGSKVCPIKAWTRLPYGLRGALLLFENLMVVPAPGDARKN